MSSENIFKPIANRLYLNKTLWKCYIKIRHNTFIPLVATISRYIQWKCAFLYKLWNNTEILRNDTLMTKKNTNVSINKLPEKILLNAILIYGIILILLVRK